MSYNVDKYSKDEGNLVYQYVFGRKVTVRLPGGKKMYRYPGLVRRPGVVHLGQSVLMMREGDAEDLIAFLRKHRVSFLTEHVWVEP